MEKVLATSASHFNKTLIPMNPPRFAPFSAATLSLALSVTAFAQTATTDPVGFITVNVAGGSPTAPKLSLISPTLTRPVVWQGLISSISSTGLTVSGNPWTNDQFNGSNGVFYVEVFSATKPGAISDIADTTVGGIITVDNLSSFAAAGDSLRIRKHVTIADFLGASNSAGLQASDDPSTADEVLIYNGATATKYFYYTGDTVDPAGWYSSGGNVPSANEIIAPHEGVVLKRIGSGNISFASIGSVKTGATLFPIVQGLNVLGTVSAAGLTLASSGLVPSGFSPSDDPSTGDEVTIYTPTTQTKYFFYTGDTTDPAGWYSSGGNAPSGTVQIPPGSSFVVNRKSGPNFNWVLPAPSSF